MTSDPHQAGDARNATDARQPADPRQAADARFSEALAATGARDPRDYYRERLRELKRTNPDGYAEGVAYYQNTLVPSIANGEADPLAAWRDYGLLLARLTAPGRAVAVDATGLSRPFEPPGDAADMVLHLPERTRDRPVLVSLPPDPTPTQLATHQWLVAGARSLGQE